VQDMFMTIPAEQAAGATETLSDGTAISINLGNASNGTDLDDFTIGSGADIEPRKIYLRVSPDRVFVNTSVRLLNRYDILYDADGGYFGVRLRPAQGQD
jgi:hypothetical protein